MYVVEKLWEFSSSRRREDESAPPTNFDCPRPERRPRDFRKDTAFVLHTFVLRKSQNSFATQKIGKRTKN